MHPIVGITVDTARQGVVTALALLLDQVRPASDDRPPRLLTALGRMTLGNVAQAMPGGLGRWGEAAVLSTTVGLMRTQRRAEEIRDCLADGDLEGAREAARLLLPDGTGDLSAEALEQAAAEAVAVSVADGVVAPLFYYAILGIPGAVGYKYLSGASTSFGERGARLLARARSGPRRVAAALYVTAGSILEQPGEALMAGWRQFRVRRSDPEMRESLVTALVEPVDDDAPVLPDGITGDGQSLARAVARARVAVATGGALLLCFSCLARGRRSHTVKRVEE